MNELDENSSLRQALEQKDQILAGALAKLREFRLKVDALENSRQEGIAVTGIGTRLPGNVTGAASFWRLLKQGGETVTPVPADRWALDDFYDPDPEAIGRTPFRYGAFLQDASGFDPYFFGISPREAARMDPQQRIFLEVAWEALEDAGLTREGLRGSRTGVFVAANQTDYLKLQLENPDEIDLYTAVGGAACIIPNRLSYLLDLRGPSLTIDSACSSALLAVHLACQSLRTGESSAAVVGGVNMIFSPSMAIAHSKGLPLAPDGRCKTFDARADGYARGEGVGVVVLKRLSDAVADGDRIWSVIRGSAVNQDGLTNGLTAPNGRSQVAVLRQAIESARLSPSQVTLIEAHGTGTALGDPIEVEALDEVYGARTDDGDGCALGSVKTSVGHLEAAAGIAGLIKVALSIHHRAIPPLPNLEKLNPHISIDGSRLFIPTELQPWDVPDEHRHGAVSAFGAGGTNAHVVLGPAPAPRPPQQTDETGPYIIPVTAGTADALAPMARAYRDFLLSPEGQAQLLGDIAYSATVRRTQHEHRLAVVAHSHKQAADRLAEWLDGTTPAGVLTGRASAGVGAGTVFVFPGQGAQRAGMGRELMKSCPVFREAVTECDRAMRRWLGHSVMDEIHRLDDTEPLEGIDLIQPALFAIAVGLAARCRAFGIQPDVVVGHSMGEVAAAHVAGALSLDDAARIICLRSRLLRRISGQGAMLVVALPMGEAARLVEGHQDRVSVAVSNSPTSTVLSGDPAVLAELAGTLRERNVFCRPVKVDVASHSPQVDVLTADLLDQLSGISPRPAEVPILSTVTGELCDGSQFDAGYWVRNLREPVLFWDAVQMLIEGEHGVFVEMSPHPTLLSAVEQGFELSGRDGVAVPAMRRDVAEGDGTAEIHAALHTHGRAVPLDRLLPEGARYAELPQYTWQHQDLWFRAGDRRYRAPLGRHGAPQADQVREDRSADTGPVDDTTAVMPYGTVGELVLHTVADILRMDAHRIDPGDGFFQLGMDSMLASRVRARIESALGLKLPASVMFEHATVTALTAHLTGLVGGAARGSEPTATDGQPSGPEPARAAAQPVDELSEDELLDELVAELRTSIRIQGDVQ
ncbi:type I polyketide synthase [Streptomyces sp. NPDC059165]|uniref:type I polyketide synthase n=1 Tax=Streptomyces sp. NPDC059165 TaxID=3346751 RepID=UPI003679FB8F